MSIESELYTNRVVQIKLSFFDTAGEEKYHAVTACHYRNAKGTIIVYDVCNRSSFENVKVWLNDTKQLATKDCVILLLGNKNDVDNTNKSIREVSTQEGFEFAVQNNITFFEVSALENANIE